MTFEKNEDNMKNMFVKEKTARANYSRKIRSNEETNDNFYETEDIKK